MSAVACVYYYMTCSLVLLHCSTYLALWRLFPVRRGQLDKDSFIHSLLLLSLKNFHPGGQSIGSTQSWQPEVPFYRQGSVILRYTLRCFLMFFEKFLIDHIISPLCNNDILSFMIYFHPYYIQERPVRSIIIISIIVIVVVIIIYYCLTGQYHSAKKGLVQLAVLCSWHYQNKSKFFFSVTTTLLSLPPPPPNSPYWNCSILSLV